MKIVIVHWKGGTSKWYPFSLETLEALGESMCAIDYIEIIEAGINEGAK